jgi:hypothetical protein
MECLSSRCEREAPGGGRAKIENNPTGRLRGSRNKLSEEVICALLRDFRQHGQKAVARVRQAQPAAYLKILALLCPREHKVEHSNVIKSLSDLEADTAVGTSERHRASGADLHRAKFHSSD